MSRISSLCIIIILCSLSRTSQAEPTYCAEMPDALIKAAHDADVKQKKFNQERDDERADAKSRKTEPLARSTASKDSTGLVASNKDDVSDNLSESGSDAMTVEDFANHDLDNSKESSRRAKEELIRQIIAEKETMKPSLQLQRWMECEDVYRVLTSNDLREPWAKRQVHRFELRWKQVRSGVEMDAQATVQTRSLDKAGHVRPSSAKSKKQTFSEDSKAMVVSDTPNSFGDDSPVIATHKKTVDNMTKYRMVTTTTTASTGFPNKLANHKLDAKHHGKIASKTTAKNAHSMKVAKKLNAKKSKTALALANHKKSRLAALKASCPSPQSKGAHDAKSKLCAKKPNRKAASATQKVAVTMQTAKRNGPALALSNSEQP